MIKQKEKFIAKKELPKNIIGARIPDVRKVVKSAMKKRGISAYKLAQILSPHVSEPTIKTYVDGKNQITSGKLELIMAVLGLEIRPKE